MVVVSVVQNKDIRQTVQEAIVLIGGIIHPNDKGLINPNLVFALS
jgi:uncharacterized protein (DUF362 family)